MVFPRSGRSRSLAAAASLPGTPEIGPAPGSERSTIAPHKRVSKLIGSSSPRMSPRWSPRVAPLSPMVLASGGLDDDLPTLVLDSDVSECPPIPATQTPHASLAKLPPLQEEGGRGLLAPSSPTRLRRSKSNPVPASGSDLSQSSDDADDPPSDADKRNAAAIAAAIAAAPPRAAVPPSPTTRPAPLHRRRSSSMLASLSGFAAGLTRRSSLSRRTDTLPVVTGTASPPTISPAQRIELRVQELSVMVDQLALEERHSQLCARVAREMDSLAEFSSDHLMLFEPPDLAPSDALLAEAKAVLMASSTELTCIDLDEMSYDAEDEQSSRLPSRAW